MTKETHYIDESVSPASLEELGMGRYAYIKQVTPGDIAHLLPEDTEVPGDHMLWLAVGADGTPLVVSDSRSEAQSAILSRDLELIQLH